MSKRKFIGNEPCSKRMKTLTPKPSDFMVFIMEMVREIFDVELGRDIASELEGFQYGQWRQCFECEEVKDANRCEWIGDDRGFYSCRECRETIFNKYPFDDEDQNE